MPTGPGGERGTMRGHVLITGATGFVGSALARVLAREWPDAEVTLADRRAGVPGVRRVEMADPEAVGALIGECEPSHVFHLAGVTRAPSLKAFLDANLEPTRVLLEAIEQHAPGARVMVPGSAAEYGDVAAVDLPIRETQALRPISAYGVSKACQCLLTPHYAARGLSVMTGRAFNVVGRGIPDTLFLGAVVRQLKDVRDGRADHIEVGELGGKRDLTDIDDICRAMLDVASLGEPGEAYNICSGVGVSMADVLDRLMTIAGLRVDVRRVGERLRQGDISDSVGSSEKLRRLSGWEPRTGLDASLRALVDEVLGA